MRAQFFDVGSAAAATVMVSVGVFLCRCCCMRGKNASMHDAYVEDDGITFVLSIVHTYNSLQRTYCVRDARAK